MRHRVFEDLTGWDNKHEISSKERSERQRREEIANLDRLKSANTTVLDIFQRSLGKLRATERDIHSPLLVVDRSKDTGKMIGVTVGLETTGYLPRATVRLDHLTSLQDRLQSIKTMSAYVFKLGPDSDQPIGVPVIDPEVSRAAVLADVVNVHPSSAYGYCYMSSTDPRTTKRRRKDFEDQVQDGEGRSVYRFCTITSAVLDSMLAAQSASVTTGPSELSPSS